MMSRIEKSKAIVLRSMKYRDTSRIVTFYTDNYGKINGILKGIRKSQNKFSTALDLMAYVQIIFYKSGTSGIHLISKCDLIDSFNSLSDNLEKLAEGMSIIELIYRVSHYEEQNLRLFKLVVETLTALDQIKRNFSNVGFIFQIKLGEILGYKLNFSTCYKCGKSNTLEINSSNLLVFDFSHGAVLCSECKSYGIHTAKISALNLFFLNKLEDTIRITSTADIEIPTQNVNEIRKFLFDYLCYHIGELRKLKSQQLFTINLDKKLNETNLCQ